MDLDGLRRLERGWGGPAQLSVAEQLQRRQAAQLGRRVVVLVVQQPVLMLVDLDHAEVPAHAPRRRGQGRVSPCGGARDLVCHVGPRNRNRAPDQLESGSDSTLPSQVILTRSASSQALAANGQ